MIMKFAKLILCLGMVAVCSLYTGSVFAKQSTASPAAKVDDTLKTIVDPGALEVGDSLISPSSPVYFLKAWRESLELYLASNDTVKAQRKLEFSVRRLREVKTLLDENRQDLVPATLKAYTQDLEMVKSYSSKDPKNALDLGLSIARHMYVLQSLYYRMSESEAKFANRETIRYVLNYNRNLLNANLSEEDRANFINGLKLREIAACQFLKTEAQASDILESEKKLISEVLQNCKSDVK